MELKQVFQLYNIQEFDYRLFLALYLKHYS